MKIVAVEPNKKELKRLVKLLNKTYSCKVVSFTNPIEAKAYITANHIDVLFAQIVMKGIFGPELVKIAKAKHNSIITVLFSKDTDYAMEAFRCHAWYYFESPATVEKLAVSLEDTAYINYRKFTLKERIKNILIT